ncbi:calponin homology domain-containing protein, partial [Baffinella frigidus]
MQAKMYKSTRDVIVAFTSDLLSGEGDVLKHLSQLGCSFLHNQSAIDEYNFQVGNVVADLKDGVVVSRLVEILFSQAQPLMDKMRVPAVSRLQKVHNAGVALTELERLGVHAGSKDEAKMIVDGHRDTVVSLLWTVAHAVQWRERFQEDVIKEEIARVRVQAGVADEKKTLLPEMKMAVKPADLLLQWCQSVCGSLGFEVENFTRSFADSRALCLLASYYLPELLPSASLGEARENFKAFSLVLDTIGGVPCMLQSSDVTNTTPDQGLMMSFVTHLCFRLIDLGKDSRAVRKIQRAWQGVLQYRREAASRAASALLQRVARGFLGRHVAKVRLGAIVKLQATARMGAAVRGYKREVKQIVKVQAALKMFAAMALLQNWLGVKRALAMADARIVARKQKVLEKKLRHLIKSCVVAQRVFRGWKAKQAYREMRGAAINIERMTRGFLVRNDIANQHAAATKIETVFRGFSERIQYHTTRDAIIHIQSAFRCFSETG